MPGRAYVTQLNQSFFGGQLAPDVVDGLSALPVARHDVRAFVERMFRLMTESGFDARDVSTVHGSVLGSLLARLLPETWAGTVPPITITGRHTKIDQLVLRVMEAAGRHTGLLVDVACGFPPLTSIDSAAALPGWRIIGIDRALPAYLVYDAEKNYALFDEHGQAMYFQPADGRADGWIELMQDWNATRERFQRLLQTLLTARAAQGSTDTRFEHDGATLETNPASAYERTNLRFVRSDLATAPITDADVVRCFNMLYYFDDAFRTSALGWFGAMLGEGGLLICGGNWAHSTECRYFTYWKRDGRLEPSEFAFSLDNLSPIGILPWYTLHDDTREVRMLADMTRVLRSDAAFRAALIAVVDPMRAEYGMCARAANGYYGGIDSSVPPSEIWLRAGHIAERLSAHELGPMAVEVLARAGWTARVNEVGHVAVRVTA